MCIVCGLENTSRVVVMCIVCDAENTSSVVD